MPQNEQKKAAFNELVSKLTDACFDKCVTKPRGSLSSGETQCLAYCSLRFMETSQVSLVHTFLVPLRPTSPQREAFSLFPPAVKYQSSRLRFLFSFFGRADRNEPDPAGRVSAEPVTSFIVKEMAGEGESMSFIPLWLHIQAEEGSPVAFFASEGEQEGDKGTRLHVDARRRSLFARFESSAGEVLFPAHSGTPEGALYKLAKAGTDAIVFRSEREGQGSEMSESFLVNVRLPLQHGLDHADLRSLLEASGALPSPSVSIGGEELKENLLAAMHPDLKGSAEDSEAMEPPGVETELYSPHQRRALSWLKRREANEDSDTSWEPLNVELEGLCVLWHPPTGELKLQSRHGEPSTQLPHEGEKADEQSCLGGIYSDETGLGKSLVMIALALSRPPPEGSGRGGTLVVAPNALMQQWSQEVLKHAPSCSVKTYRGLKKHLAQKQHRKRKRKRGQAQRWEEVERQWERQQRLATENLSLEEMPGAPPSAEAAEGIAEDLRHATFVLTTYGVLQQEVWYDGSGREESLRRHKLHRVPKCPLEQISWQRAVFDESQKVGVGLGNVAKMAMRIDAVHRHAVTGTPFSSSGTVRDLGSLLRTVEHEPLHAPDHFQSFSKPPGQVVAARCVLREVGWRSTRADMENGSALPRVNVNEHALDQSPAERSFYEHVREQEHATMDARLEQLRLSCIHPQLTHSWQSANSELQVHSGALAVREMVERLMHRAQTSLHKYERDFCSGANAIAAGRAHNDPQDAVRLLEEAWEVADKGLLQKGKEEAVNIETHPGALRRWQRTQMTTAAMLSRLLPKVGRDEEAERFGQEAEKLREEYLMDPRHEVDKYKERYQGLWTAAESLGSEMCSLDHHASSLGTNYDILFDGLGCQKWLDDTRTAFEKNLEEEANAWEETGGQEVDEDFLHDDDEGAGGASDKVENLAQQQSRQQEISSPTLAHLKKVEQDVQVRRSGFQGMAVEQALLPVSSRLSELRKRCESEPQRQRQHDASWLAKAELFLQVPPEVVVGLYSVAEVGGRRAAIATDVSTAHLPLSLGQGVQRFLRSSQAQVNHKLRQVQSEKRNVEGKLPQESAVYAAKTAKKQASFLQKLRELYRSRCRKALAERNLAKSQREAELAISARSAAAIGSAKGQRKAETARIQAEREVNRVRSLQSRLAKEGPSDRNTEQEGGNAEKGASPEGNEAEDETCPVCWSHFEDGEANMLPCGHLVCQRCASTAAFVRSTACFYCRQPCRPGHAFRVKIGGRKGRPSGIAGEWGAKIEKAVSLVKSLPEDEKVLIFSHSPQGLTLFGRALRLNGMEFVSLLAGSSLDPSALARFNQGSQPKAFLIALHAGSSGLTLVRANHVVFLEPCLSEREEHQAIARVNRIGQTREVYVHHLVVRSTVEEVIRACSSPDSIPAAELLSRDPGGAPSSA